MEVLYLDFCCFCPRRLDHAQDFRRANSTFLFLPNRCRLFFAVDSNDAMYGFDRKFLNEVNKISGTLLRQVMSHLQTLDKPEVRVSSRTHLFLRAYNVMSSKSHMRVSDNRSITAGLDNLLLVIKVPYLSHFHKDA